jgi:RHS repeat-associated protein
MAKSWAEPPTTSFLFAGEQLDPSGLYYLRARYYDPHAGRFTQMDPFPGLLTLPGTLNPYLYTLNNPVNWVDPSGKIVWIPALILMGGLMAGTFKALEYLLSTPIGCLSLPGFGEAFWNGFLPGLVGSAIFWVIAAPLILSGGLPAWAIGAIAGFAGGAASGAIGSFMSGRGPTSPAFWGDVLMGGAIGAFAGYTSGRWYDAATRIGNPKWQPKLEWFRPRGLGWPWNKPGTSIGPRSVATLKADILNDTLGELLNWLGSIMR